MKKQDLELALRNAEREASLNDMAMNDLMASRFERATHRREVVRYSRLDAAHGGIVFFCDGSSDKYGPHYRCMYLDDFERTHREWCLSIGCADPEFEHISALAELGRRIQSLRSDMFKATA